MYGAIIGDFAGSIYEFSQIKNVHPVSISRMIEEQSFYSDDTILTIAVLDAILHQGDYEIYMKKYIAEYFNYKPDFKPYFKTTFSPRLLEWYEGKREGKSIGNGAMMRIAAVGYLFDCLEDVMEQAKLATIPSHCSVEAIEAAQTVAQIIYYARIGMTKEKLMHRFAQKISYQPFSKFNTTCSETLPNCLYALFSSHNYEQAIYKVISFGGDTDTNACIVGSMAEALYGIGENSILSVQSKLPASFTNVLEQGYCKIKK